jgi:hypothetical protein
MRAACVITSIMPPNDAVGSFAASQDIDHVIVVGDRKSPPSYALGGVRFMSVAEQEGLGWRVLAQLPYNHYCRKVLGYLEAARAGAEFILESDDDNLVIPGRQCAIWRCSSHHEFGPATDALRFVNVYRHFTDQFIWPRGLPLRAIVGSNASPELAVPSGTAHRIGVWQGLAQGDPDVDAIYRLTYGGECNFRDEPPVTLAPGVVCPFNSQNTAFLAELLPLMYLPAFVTFRYTDILRSLVAQPILWATGLRLCFVPASVVQLRNAHDLLRDFESEVPMYLTTERAIELAASAVSASQSIGDNLASAYAALERGGIVESRERHLLDLWLADCERALRGRQGIPHGDQALASP